MKKLITIIVILIIFTGLKAQDTLYVHKKDGSTSKVQLRNTDSLKIITGVLEYTATEIQLNKNNFNKWNGDPTIPYQEYASSFGIDKIWNNKWGAAGGSGDCYSTKSGGGVSNSITFDLNKYADNATGKRWVIPTRMKIYARYTYNYMAIGKNIRVWGSTSPTVSTANTSGPDAWVLLSPEEGFLLAPPSGQSGLAPTTSDKKYIEEDGYELFFKADAPPIRYIRLEMVSRWNTALTLTSFTIGEVTIWGKEKNQAGTLCVVRKDSSSIKFPISNIDSVKFEGPLSPDFVYDIDLNPYRTVKIGTQTWMVDNLKTTRFRNGDVISNVTENTAWSTPTAAAWCNYANDPTYADTYGYLYNSKAVTDGRKLAPAGWHIATDYDWSLLTTFLGGDSVAASKLKETGTMHWQANNSSTNETGFTALPGGWRDATGTFRDNGLTGGWWTSTFDNISKIWYRMINENPIVKKGSDIISNGFSVRCVKNELPQITVKTLAINGNNAVYECTIPYDGGDAITARGVCFSTNPLPTVNDSKAIIALGGSGAFSASIVAPLDRTTYYVRAYATNSVGTTYSDTMSFTTPDNRVYDIDGNTYHAITIGTQTWMAEDLKTTRYRNGEIIENVADSAAWSILTTPAMVVKSGAFYNWYAVNDSRKIAPEGWHIPTDAEWTTLSTYLGGVATAGGKLKMTGFQFWDTPNTDASNASGFTALPNGLRYNTGAYKSGGKYGYWWTTTEYDATTSIFRSLQYFDAILFKSNYLKNYGLSVRCIKD